MPEDEDVSGLELESLKRRQRLLQLKQKVHTLAAQAQDIKNNDSEIPLKKAKFRSYKPEDHDLQKTALDSARPADVEVEIKDIVNIVHAVTEELDLNKLVPKKPDHDLKRSLQDKLDKLKRRTNRAIAELIRERLKSE